MLPSNFHPCGVRPYVRPPLHVNQVEILHFKYTRISAVNRSIATRTFRDKKQQQRSRFSVFRLNFKVYIGVDNRERARARDKETKETNFVWRITWKFYSGCEKNEKRLAATKVKRSGSERKVNRTANNISSIKRVPRKFLEVPRCRHAKQRQRNIKKVCCTCKVFCFAK